MVVVLLLLLLVFGGVRLVVVVVALHGRWGGLMLLLLCLRLWRPHACLLACCLGWPQTGPGGRRRLCGCPSFVGLSLAPSGPAIAWVFFFRWVCGGSRSLA